MSQPYLTIRRSAYNAWVPQSNRIHNEVVSELLERVKDRVGHKAAVIQFDQDVTPAQKKLFEDALVQVKQYYAKWADNSTVVGNWESFLKLLDGIVELPPDFYRTKHNGVTIGEPIGVPIYLILDLVSNTSAAYTLFTDGIFNAAVQKLLNSWGKYLATEGNGSNGTLTKEKWFSPEGLVVLQSGLGKWSFWETYEVDIKDESGNPKEPYYKSWDSFFTRQLKKLNPDGGPTRPIQRKTDEGTVFINNACESTILRTATNVQVNDTFWLKEQNYSIYDILGGGEEGSLAEFAPCFLGGSVFQAFLSPADYHRWHSPVKGKILASNVLGGSYYAVLPDSGAPLYDPDLAPGDPHGALVRSQPWLTVKSTRAVYIIQPTDPDLHLKLVALIGIGMGEVSTCQIDEDILKKERVDVDVGEQVGMFRFGGSSHALLLKPEDGYEIVFQDVYDTPIRTGQHRWINSGIAQVRVIDSGVSIQPVPKRCPLDN